MSTMWESHVNVKCGNFDADRDGKIRLQVTGRLGGKMLESVAAVFAARQMNPTVPTIIFTQDYENAATAAEVASKIQAEESPGNFCRSVADRQYLVLSKAEDKTFVFIRRAAFTSGDVEALTALFQKAEVQFTFDASTAATVPEVIKGDSARLPFLSVLKGFQVNLRATYTPFLLTEFMKKDPNTFDETFVSAFGGGNVEIDAEVDTYEELPAFTKAMFIRPEIINLAQKIATAVHDELPFWTALKSAVPSWKCYIYLPNVLSIQIEGTFLGSTSLL